MTLKQKYADILIISIYSIFLISIITLFSQNYLILGGEGNYFLDFITVTPLYRYTWIELMAGTGGPNPFIHYSFIIFDFFTQLQSLDFSIKTINTIGVFLNYFLPFISIYFVLRKILKISIFISLLISLFYIFNPFSTFQLGELMFWNSAPMAILPIAFGIIYQYFDNSRKLFTYFGIFSVAVSFGFANIPYLGIFNISIVIFLFIISALIKNKLNLKKVTANFIILETSFILFNLWWIIPLITYQLGSSQLFSTAYTKDFAISWARQASGDGLIMTKLFTLKTLIPLAPNNSFFSLFYHNRIITIFLLVPFALVLCSLLQKNKEQHKYITLSALFILAVMFLNKGVNEPFSDLYVLLLEKVPLFILFKSPLEKFSVLLVFLLSLHLAYFLNNNSKKTFLLIFCLVLVISSIPYLTLNFIPDRDIGDGKYVSKLFIDKPEYQNLRSRLNEENLIYRVMSLPGSINYQVTMSNHDNKYYRGMDPILNAINKPFIAAYSGSHTDILYNNISDKNFNKLLAMYNIRNIIINNDIYPSYGFMEKENINQIINLFNASKKYSMFLNDGQIVSYKLDDQYFQPLFYIPKNLIISNKSIESLPEIVIQEDYNIISAVLFKKQNEDKYLNIIGTQINSTPVLEFKRINPFKYRLLVHNAKDNFLLVFSESFNSRWNIYLTSDKLQPEKIENFEYLCREVNNKDCIEKEELNKLVINNSVSAVGERFISKNIHNTIQNDNLADGKSYETWFIQPLDSSHIVVNGYANAWWIDLDTIKKQGNYKINGDGSYDFELIVEYSPQRLFYIATAISILTILGCLGYIIIGRKKF